MRAFQIIQKRFPEAALFVAGFGTEEAELKRLAEDLKLERVEFVGFRDWDDLPAEYGQADVLCVPSRYDGWGMVVPEALAAGLPVIATGQTGATLDLIEPDRNGWLIPAGDEGALYQAMKKAVLLSPAQFSERSRAARQTISQHSLSDGVERFWCAAQGTLAEFDDRTATSDS